MDELPGVNSPDAIRNCDTSLALLKPLIRQLALGNRQIEYRLKVGC